MIRISADSFVDFSFQLKQLDVFFYSLDLVFAACVLYLLFPGFTTDTVRRISESPGESFIVGVALLLFMPFVLALLMLVVFGHLVGMGVFMFYLVTLIAGLLFFCFMFGDWLAKQLRQEVKSKTIRLIAAAVAIIIVGLIGLIPVVGKLIVIGFILLGFGAGILELFNYYRAGH